MISRFDFNTFSGFVVATKQQCAVVRNGTPMNIFYGPGIGPLAQPADRDSQPSPLHQGRKAWSTVLDWMVLGDQG